MRDTTQNNGFIVSLRSLQGVWVQGVIDQVSAGENDKGNILTWKTNKSLEANDQTFRCLYPDQYFSV